MTATVYQPVLGGVKAQPGLQGVQVPSVGLALLVAPAVKGAVST
jgi:hypothetical protein